MTKPPSQAVTPQFVWGINTCSQYGTCSATCFATMRVHVTGTFSQTVFATRTVLVYGICLLTV